MFAIMLKLAKFQAVGVTMLEPSPFRLRPGIRGTLGGYLPDFVLGANDGVITTLAVVWAVVGASLSSTVVLILGFANLIADGFSMAAVVRSAFWLSAFR
jgi:hypothetical protein